MAYFFMNSVPKAFLFFFKFNQRYSFLNKSSNKLSYTETQTTSNFASRCFSNDAVMMLDALNIGKCMNMTLTKPFRSLTTDCCRCVSSRNQVFKNWAIDGKLHSTTSMSLLASSLNTDSRTAWKDFWTTLNTSGCDRIN